MDLMHISFLIEQGLWIKSKKAAHSHQLAVQNYVFSINASTFYCISYKVFIIQTWVSKSLYKQFCCRILRGRLLTL